MSTADGLLYALRLDGNGRGRHVGWEGLSQSVPQGEFMWVHLDYTAERAQDWIISHSGLSEADIDVLLKEETRPRSTITQNGLLVVLRGVNMNPGADPEDMVALRMWVNGSRIISTRCRRHMWEADMLKAIETGEGPVSSGDFLGMVAEFMVGRIQDVVEDLEERVGELEETMLAQKSESIRGQLADLRRQAINLHRYLAPQRDALARLQSEKINWFSDTERMSLREVHDWMVRAVEDLDATRERAAIANEELASSVTEQLNQRMYMLSMIAALFMPLTFLTGLLGINVGGIPGAENKQAFLWVCYILMAIGFVLYFIFRKRKWM